MTPGQVPHPDVVATRARALGLAAGYHGILRRAAREAGGYLAGDDGGEVASSVKGVESLAGKAERMTRRMNTLNDALLSMADLNRYTVILDESRYTRGVEQVRDRLTRDRLVWEGGRNTWDDPFYKGYNTRFRDQTRPHAAADPAHADASTPRHPVEVQFHTEESFAAKSENHDLYEMARTGDLDDRMAAAAMELQARRSEGVTVPAGAERLPERVPPRERPEVPEQDVSAARELTGRLEAGAETTTDRGIAATRGPGEAGVAPGRSEVVESWGSRSPPQLPAELLDRLTPEQSPAGRPDEADLTADPDAGRAGPER